MSDKSKTNKPSADASIWKNKSFLLFLGLVCAAVIIYAGMQYFGDSKYRGVPKRSVAAYKQGVEALDNNDPEKALDALFKAIELDGTFADAHARVAEAYFIASQKHKAQKNSDLRKSTLEESRNYVQKALNVDPKNGIAYFVKGLHAHEDKNIDEAIQNLELAESYGADLFELHSMLGYLYNEKEMTAKCVEQYEKAYRIRPNDTRTLFNLGELYYGVENYKKAIQYYGELLKYEPKVTKYKAKYAASMWKDGKVENARALINQVLESEEDKFYNYNDVAWILIDKDLDVPWGIQIALAANELKPNNLISTDILGWGYYKNKEYAKAVDYLNRSMNFAPSEEVKRRLQMAKEKLDESVKP